jgi:hypothetical protein
VERFRHGIIHSWTLDIPSNGSNNPIELVELSPRSLVLSLLAKGLLRPPLLLALYMLDIDHFEVYEVPSDFNSEEESSYHQMGLPQFNQASGTVAMAALHTWAVDLMDSVACWL